MLRHCSYVCPPALLWLAVLCRDSVLCLFLELCRDNVLCLFLELCRYILIKCRNIAQLNLSYNCRDISVLCYDIYFMPCSVNT